MIKKHPVSIGIGIGVSGVLLAAGLSACSQKNTEPYRDAPRDGVDRGAAKIVEMPDGFSNLATKCLQGTSIRVTVVYHGDHTYGSVSQVVDPSCKVG